MFAELERLPAVSKISSEGLTLPICIREEDRRACPLVATESYSERLFYSGFVPSVSGAR